MTRELLPYSHQCIDDADIQAVVEALKSDKITTGGRVEQFEKKVASYCRARYAVAVSSGTAALHCAYHVADIGEGDEVITTPMTFFATVSAIMISGARPVLVDINPETLNIDTQKIQSKITEKTKAIAPVDFGGNPVDIGDINDIAKYSNLIVVEDASHALGADYYGWKVGFLADMTVFSFHPVKAITTGEGGMVLTNDEEYYSELRRFRDHNIWRTRKHWEYDILDVGYNYRLSDLACALGISQMDRLDSFIKRRRDIAKVYDYAFMGNDEIIIMENAPLRKSAYHLYPIQLRSLDRDEFIEKLMAKGIYAQVHYIPVHYLSCMRRAYGYKEGDYLNAERYYSRCLSLPIYPKMTDGDVAYVIDTVKGLVGV